MNLQDTWNNLGLDNVPEKNQVRLHKFASRHPIQRLRRSYLISVILSIVFLFFFIVLFFRFHEPIVQLGIAFMTVAYIAFSWINFTAYRRVKVNVSMDEDMKSALQHTHDFIVANIRYQERVGLFVYPFALAAGYLMGLSDSSGDATGMIGQYKVLLALGILIVIFTPLCWLLARWMYNVSFGAHLKALKSLIAELEKKE